MKTKRNRKPDQRLTERLTARGFVAGRHGPMIHGHCPGGCGMSRDGGNGNGRK